MYVDAHLCILACITCLHDMNTVDIHILACMCMCVCVCVCSQISICQHNTHIRYARMYVCVCRKHVCVCMFLIDYLPAYFKSSVMTVLGCNGLRCVIKNILSLSLPLSASILHTFTFFGRHVRTCICLFIYIYAQIHAHM